MNKREIQKTLMESCFNPKEKVGPISLILKSADSNYLLQRAMECLEEARTPKGFHSQVRLAISLLALARVKEGDNF